MVTKQEEASTPMQEWVSQALERMKPILDGTGIDQLNNHFWEHGSHAHKDMITNVLDRVEWLAQHFKVLPEPLPPQHCCHSLPCHLTAYSAGHQAGYIEAMTWAKDKVKDIRVKMEAQV